MPYIKQDRRADVLRYVRFVNRQTGGCATTDMPQDCGELNFAFTMLCLQHSTIRYHELDASLEQVAREYLMDPAKPLRYQRINDVAGAAACAGLELERRRPVGWSALISTLNYVMRKPYADIGVPYELLKIAENGDIAEYIND